jgi:hypothetical protein
MTGSFIATLEPLGPFEFECKPYVLALSPVKIPKADRKLVAWWKFDEAEGDEAADSSGNNFIGTLSGNPQWQPSGGKVGGALSFDGVDDYLDCGSDPSLNVANAVTVAAWIKLSESVDDQKIVSNQDDLSGGYKFGIFSNKVELEIRDSGNVPTQNRLVEGGTVLESDTWYHLVGTYCQGGAIKTYVNGKLDREVPVVSLLATSTGTLKIGREPFGDMYLFNGLMDEVSIYNYALSEADVAEIYSGKSPLAVAPTAILAAGEKQAGESSGFVPILIIVVIAIAAAGFAIHKIKAAV